TLAALAVGGVPYEGHVPRRQEFECQSGRNSGATGSVLRTRATLAGTDTPDSRRFARVRSTEPVAPEIRRVLSRNRSPYSAAGDCTRRPAGAAVLYPALVPASPRSRPRSARGTNGRVPHCLRVGAARGRAGRAAPAAALVAAQVPGRVPRPQAGDPRALQLF